MSSGGGTDPDKSQCLFHGVVFHYEPRAGLIVDKAEEFHEDCFALLLSLLFSLHFAECSS